MLIYNKRCKACVNWQETNEPGTETLPGPSMALQPDTTLAVAPVNPNPSSGLSALVNSTAQAGNGDGDEVCRLLFSLFNNPN